MERSLLYGHWEPWLVALSVAVAVEASYVGMRIAAGVPAARGVARRLRLIGSALSLALGIWGMHFVGMLAMPVPVEIAYAALPTLLSFLVCVLVVGAALIAASLSPRTRPAFVLTALAMGGGIVVMHYIGMAALSGPIVIAHDPRHVAAAIAAAVAASALALWLAFMARYRPPLILCALVLGGAVSSMHYIAVSGMSIVCTTEAGAPGGLAAPSLSSGLMALVVAVVVFIVCGGFLLTLVPEAEARIGGAAAPGTQAIGRAPPIIAAPPGEAAETAGEAGPVPALAADDAAGLLPGLPIERDGTSVPLPVGEIVSVRANAHYSYVNTGREEFFCSLSIGDVEQRLQGGPFLRVHRSHIVDLTRVVALRRVGDGGILDLAGAAPLSVPVSRAKLGEVRGRLDAMAGAVALRRAVPSAAGRSRPDALAPPAVLAP